MLETRQRPFPWLVLISVSIAQFSNSATVSGVTVILPYIARDLSITAAQAQWVVSGFFLATVSLVLTFGSVADRLGWRRVFLAGVVTFAAAGLLSGLAPNLLVLVPARLLQGAGSAMILATNVPLLFRALPPEARGRAVGMLMTIVLAGTVMGPVVGSLLVHWLHWRWVFWYTVPLTVATYSLSWRSLPADGAPGQHAAFDWPGMAVYTAAMAALVFGLSGTGAGPRLVWLAAAAMLLMLFVAIELRQPAPLMRLALLRRRRYALSVLGQLPYFIGYAAATFVVPFFLVQVQGRSSGETGLVMTALMLFSSAGALAGGWLTDRAGSPATWVGGMLVVLAGHLWLLRLPLGASTLETAAALAVAGLGGGFFLVANRVILGESLPAADLSMGNALHVTSRHTGMLTGTALAAALATGPGNSFAAMPPLVAALAACALSLVLGLGVRRGRAAPVAGSRGGS